jgi:[CysO sulfur-carrier protein]-S-L-cysteine hydrolase
VERRVSARRGRAGEKVSRFDHPAGKTTAAALAHLCFETGLLWLPRSLLTVADLSIPQRILDDMIAHARELDPYECCGLLAGKNGTVTQTYRIKNIVALDGAEKLSSFDPAKVAHLERLSPAERAEIAFVMDMQDFSAAKKDIRNRGLDLQVVYHSHPHDPARPSVTDIKIASDYEEIWPKINLLVPAYLLISLLDKAKPDIRTYWIKGGTVSPAFVVTV